MRARTDSSARPAKVALVLASAATALLAAGCSSQQNAGYYDMPRGSSTSDSIYRAEGAGARTITRAPSQLQISLDRGDKQPVQPGDTAPTASNAPGQESDIPPQPAGAANQPAARMKTAAPGEDAYNPRAAGFAPQARTYLGTLPCLSPGAACISQKVDLTIAPNGRWRARLTPVLPATAAPAFEQGCWDATAVRPIRLILSDGQGNTHMDFVAENNNLRVNSMYGRSPNLDYQLTRQPDLDAIEELNGKPAPSCS